MICKAKLSLPLALGVIVVAGACIRSGWAQAVDSSPVATATPATAPNPGDLDWLKAMSARGAYTYFVTTQDLNEDTKTGKFNVTHPHGRIVVVVGSATSTGDTPIDVKVSLDSVSPPVQAPLQLFMSKSGDLRVLTPIAPLRDNRDLFEILLGINSIFYPRPGDDAKSAGDALQWSGAAFPHTEYLDWRAVADGKTITLSGLDITGDSPRDAVNDVAWVQTSDGIAFETSHTETQLIDGKAVSLEQINVFLQASPKQ